MKEYDFYQKTKNWNFKSFKIETENLTDWQMYEILKTSSDENSIILDLGTGGGENVIKKFPKVKQIIATDFSEEMIKTANENLLMSGRTDITFKIMDNLNMDLEENYFDVVVARHTPTDPNQLYKVLKANGILIIRGVDKLDCWELKLLFNKGQGFNDTKTMAQLDYEAVLNAGFKDVELVPLYSREYYRTKEDFINFLKKVPIINFDNEYCDNFELDFEILNTYINRNLSDKGIILRRVYYGITARK